MAGQSLPPVPPDNASLKESAEALMVIQKLVEKQLQVVERQEQANIQKEKANEKAAKRATQLTWVSLGIATASFAITAWASWADWQGDSSWQSEQVTELRNVNERLQKVLALQTDASAEQQRQIEELLGAISERNAEERNPDLAAGQSSNSDAPEVTGNE